MKFKTVIGEELEKRVGKWEPPPTVWMTENGEWAVYLGRQLSPELQEAKVIAVIRWPGFDAVTVYPYFVVTKQKSNKSRDDIARMMAIIVLQQLADMFKMCSSAGGIQDVVKAKLEALANRYGKIERDGNSTFCRLNINKIRKHNADCSPG